eukprot:scaffold23.g4158.t1
MSSQQQGAVAGSAGDGAGNTQQHAALAALAAHAMGAIVPPREHSYGALSPGPRPHLGARVFAVELPRGANMTPEQAAEGAAAALATHHCLWSMPPHASGATVMFVAPECSPARAAVARAAAPGFSRHGWAASGGKDLRASATPADAQLPTCIVVLPAGKALGTARLQNEAAAAQGLAAAWSSVGAAAPQLSSAQWTGVLLAADTLAGVVAQVTALPLASADGRPDLALFATRVVLFVAASGSAAALEQLRMPAEAWEWLVHSAAHGDAARSPIALTEISSWPVVHQRWLQELVTDAMRIGLCAQAALPWVVSGWSQLSYLRRVPTNCALLVAAPVRRLRALEPLGLARATRLLGKVGLRLALGPLELRGTLCSRSGLQLLAVEGEGLQRLRSSSEEEAALLADLRCSGVRFANATGWLSLRRAEQLGAGLSASASDALAAVVRRQLQLQQRQPLGGAEDDSDDEDADCWEAEQRGLAVSLKSRLLGNQSCTVERMCDAFGISSAQAAAGGVSTDVALQLKQVLLATAAAPGGGGGPPGGGGPAVHVLGRASSMESKGGLGLSLGKQFAAVNAALAQALRWLDGPWPCIRLWGETCSSHDHAPPDRVVLRELLAALQPGDVVVVASPDRLARRARDVAAILAALSSRCSLVLVAAVGQQAAAPLAVLAASDAAAAVLGSDAMAQVASLQAIVSHVSAAFEAQSVQHGTYAAQHAFMQRESLDPLPRKHPVAAALSALVGSRTLLIFARTSDEDQQGNAQATVGAAADGTLGGDSLSRQTGFITAVAGSACAAPAVLSCNGHSISGEAARQHPLLQALRSGRVGRGSVVVATAVDRLSRAPGTLAELRAAALDCDVDVLLLLPSSEVLDAMEPSAYATSALGAELAGRLPPGVAAALQAHVARNHRLARLTSSNPVLLPVAVTRCDGHVQAALQVSERHAVGFAAGRQSSFSNVVDSRAAGAAAAAVTVFKRAAALQGVEQRGVGAQQEIALVAAATAAITEQLGGTSPEGGLDIALGTSRSGRRSWSCVFCNCQPGQPKTGCSCRCTKCRRALESVCGCQAACDRGGRCSCPRGCSCGCTACHRQPLGGEARQVRTDEASADATEVSDSGAPAGVGGSRSAMPTGGGGGGGVARCCARAGCSKQCGRSYAQFCSDTCYVAHCEAEGEEPDRCPRGSECVAANPPGVIAPGMVYGRQRCAACHNSAENAKQTAKRMSAAAAAAASGSSDAEGGGNKRQKRHAERIDWTGPGVSEGLLSCAEACVATAVASRAALKRLSWGGLKSSPVEALRHANSQQASGAWGRLPSHAWRIQAQRHVPLQRGPTLGLEVPHPSELPCCVEAEAVKAAAEAAGWLGLGKEEQRLEALGLQPRRMQCWRGKIGRRWDAVLAVQPEEPTMQGAPPPRGVLHPSTTPVAPPLVAGQAPAPLDRLPRHRAAAPPSARALSSLLQARPSQPARGARSLRRPSARLLLLRAAADRGPFQGVYGTWEITDADVAEVVAYRAGLTVAASAFAAGTLGALLPADAPLAAALAARGDALAAAGAAGLGLSLALIHIYVDPLKKALQALAAAGAAGGAYLALTQPEPLPAYVAAHPGAVWLVGPLFAALTGVAVKEGICYGKPEAFALALLTPALLLGHLAGALGGDAERVLAAGVAGLLALFAGRKYTQPYKDDIGDGSVFALRKLSPGAQAARLAQLREAATAAERQRLSEAAE